MGKSLGNSITAAAATLAAVLPVELPQPAPAPRRAAVALSQPPAPMSAGGLKAVQPRVLPPGTANSKPR
jgi:hypothetical protein